MSSSRLCGSSQAVNGVAYSMHLSPCRKGFNFNFLISGKHNEQFRSPTINQTREWAGNLQPQFLFTALFWGIYQLRGFVGKEWKARLPWLKEQRQQFPGKPAQGGWEHTAFGLKLHCKVILSTVE